MIFKKIYQVEWSLSLFNAQCEPLLLICSLQTFYVSRLQLRSCFNQVAFRWSEIIKYLIVWNFTHQFPLQVFASPQPVCNKKSHKNWMIVMMHFRRTSKTHLCIAIYCVVWRTTFHCRNSITGNSLYIHLIDHSNNGRLGFWESVIKVRSGERAYGNI